ncbi:iron ABC transporter ATP-binding protein [Rhodobacterales bacterium 52_120_T64]|nr:iron ABC transporter ATP-binding protein [Rhodobacterales bacterium 52_120_T64]
MAAHLDVSNVSWGPSNTHRILHPVSFSVKPGRVLAIVGANGAGKSTLLRLLYRFHRPRSGFIKIDGRDIWEMDARSAARRIAAVLQEQPTDFALNVREIVALGRTPHRTGLAGFGTQDAQIVTDALERLGLTAFSNRAFGTLSGGERQRVMVARSLAQEPEVLMLDEPTNHLDIRHRLEVLSLVRGLGPTVVCSLHDLNLAVEFADDIVVLANGRMLGFGPAKTVLTEPLIAEAFSVGARIETLPKSGVKHFSFHL